MLAIFIRLSTTSLFNFLIVPSRAWLRIDRLTFTSPIWTHFLPLATFSEKVVSLLSGMALASAALELRQVGGGFLDLLKLLEHLSLGDALQSLGDVLGDLELGDAFDDLGGALDAVGEADQVEARDRAC